MNVVKNLIILLALLKCSVAQYFKDDEHFKAFLGDCKKGDAACKGIVDGERAEFSTNCWKGDKPNCDVILKVAKKKEGGYRVFLWYVHTKPKFRYAAFGLGKLRGMVAGLLVFECIMPNQEPKEGSPKPEAFISYVEGLTLPTRLKADKYPTGVTIIRIDEADHNQVYPATFPKYTICAYELPETVRVKDKGVRKFSLVMSSGEKWLSIVNGEMSKEKDKENVITRHTGVTSQRVQDIMEGGNGRGAILIKIHGVMMTLIYFLLMPLATIIGRFYRETWSRHKVWEKRLWFSIHVSLLYVCVALAPISYVCIAIEFFIWPEAPRAQRHALIGTWSIIFLFIQSILPWILPKSVRYPKARRAYSVIHAFFGFTCYFLGLLNMGLASYFLPLYQPCEGLLITFIWMGCHCSIFILLTTLLYIKDHEMRKINNRLRAFTSCPMKVKTMEDAPGTRMRLIFLGIFIMLSFLCTVAMMVVVLKGGQCQKFLSDL